MWGDCPQTWLWIFPWVPDSFKILVKAMVIFFPEKCTITNIHIQLQGIHDAPESLSNLQGNFLIYFSRLRTWGEEEAVLKEKGGVRKKVVCYPFMYLSAGNNGAVYKLRWQPRGSWGRRFANKGKALGAGALGGAEGNLTRAGTWASLRGQ